MEGLTGSECPAILLVPQTRRASKGRRYTKAQRRTKTEGVVQEFEDVDRDIEGQHGDGAYFVYVRNIWSSIRADLDHQCSAYGLCQRDADGCKTRQNARPTVLSERQVDLVRLD